ncbi:VOC family protein [Jannaschia aquimarina]|uniref:Glyoxalase-like domain protein n=1 Tax=Jannaschia aquimarina TaxID=935700 RepID=A0A0D1EEC3_9RHOB|nr:VOC family protein [Jannaschia aquimarina]KIT16059.1 Glyoxalase-like domain protein [Jannaschia aquimarina]SNT01336.1 hypothetical protein SAMN05421775_104242 [Jannaschia aquimarina]
MKLGLFALLVPDYDPALAFFVGGLGWTCLVDEDQGRKRWVVVEAPAGGKLLLARAEGAQRDAIGTQFGGRVGLFLETDDFDRDAVAIKAAGGHFEEAPRDEPYGRVAVWRDPWGNRWDLIQPGTTTPLER